MKTVSVQQMLIAKGNANTRMYKKGCVCRSPNNIPGHRNQSAQTFLHLVMFDDERISLVSCQATNLSFVCLARGGVTYLILLVIVQVCGRYWKRLHCCAHVLAVLNQMCGFVPQ